MKLMRHSDLNLTTRRYTDEAGLASHDAVMKLPGFPEFVAWYRQIGAQISVETGQNLSQAGEPKRKKTTLQATVYEGLSSALAGGVACGQMVRAAGFEPAKGKNT